MKKYLIGLAVCSVSALFLTGCAVKNTNMEFSKPYSIYMGERAYSKVFLSGVKYAASDTKIVGSIINSAGAVEGYLTTSTDMQNWFGEAFEKEVRAAGFTPLSDEKNADFSVSMSVQNLEMKYLKSELTGKNLMMKLQIEVSIKKAGNTVTKKYGYNESKWIKPTFNALELADIYEPFLRESVAATVKDLVAISKNR